MADRREHDPAMVYQCQELYVIDGLTLAEVAERTGVATRTVERWSAEYGWGQARADYRRAEGEIRAREVLARSALIERVITEADAQAAFGFASLQTALLKAREVSLKERAELVPAPTREIKTPADAVAVLQDVVQAALGRMLADPQGVSLARLRDLRGSLELIEELQAKYAPESGEKDKAGGLSSALMDRIHDAMRPA